MNIIVPTDASPEVAASVDSQNLTTEDAGHLTSILKAYYALDERPLPDTTPTDDSIKSAVHILKDELLGRFGPRWRQGTTDEPDDFDEEWGEFAPEGFANALAMVVQPLARRFIPGSTPLYWVRGDGAEDFVEAVCSLYFPEPVVRVKWHGHDPHFAEGITEGLQWLPSIFKIDGRDRKNSSKALEQALSAATWTGTVADGDSLMTLPIRCLWVTTDARALSDRLLRQTIGVEAEGISDYRECRWQPLPAFVVYNRPKFYGAALTLIRAWLEVGKPAFKDKRHWYSGWGEVMGGILQVAEVPGFLHNPE